MKKLFLSASLAFLFFGGMYASDQSLNRDLIILLDDNEETNPGKIGAEIYRLQNALQAEVAPILVSASLWRTFITARQEWMVQSQIPETDEYKATELMKNINERINYWFDIIGGDCNDIHTCSLVADKINTEFYVKERYEQLQKEGIVPNMNDTLSKIRFCAAMTCYFDAWYWFYLDTGYYLAIPKKYSLQFTNSTNLTDILVSTGFNTSLVQHIVDPLDVMLPMTFDDESLIVDATIIPTLQYLFQKKSSEKDNYQWYIRVHGHGSNYKFMQKYEQSMVGMSLDMFKNVCNFFNTNLYMNLLWVTSCKAGGVNRIALNDGGKIYHYPIVVECLGDVYTYADLDVFDFLPDGSFLCKDYHLKKIDNKWQLWDKVSKRLNKFFKKIHTLKRDFDQCDLSTVQEQVYEAFAKSVRKPYLANTPHILISNSNRWFLCYPAWATYLNTQSALLAEVCKVPQILRTHTILFDAPVFMAELCIADKAVEQLIIVTPGNSNHYCTTLSTQIFTAEEILQCFGPYDGSAFTKQFLFDAITCVNDPEDAFAKVLGLTEDTVTFNNVIIQIVKAEQIVAIFTAPSGDAFTVTMRKMNGKSSIRNLQKLSPKAARLYNQHYEKTKAALLDTATTAYAPLKAKYAQALSKETVA